MGNRNVNELNVCWGTPVLFVNYLPPYLLPAALDLWPL